MTVQAGSGAVVAPTLEEIRAARARLGESARRTPVWRWRGPEIEGLLGSGTEVWLKLELLQFSGTFKLRGAILNLLALSSEQLARGITAVSAGNHAMAVGYAARLVGTSAKVVMPRTANPARVAGCRAFGTEVILADDVHAAFREVERLEREEGRFFVHPFEGPVTALGTATVGLELLEEAPDLDAVVVPVGGGGLCAGIAAAVGQARPECQVFGVEPDGADSMHRSFAAGEPQSIPKVETIADSLGAPHAAPYSFALCQRYVHELVKVDDDALRRSMALIAQELKFAVEPACAASTAAVLGPLRERLTGRRVGLIFCGSNIDAASFAAHVEGLGRQGPAPSGETR